MENQKIVVGLDIGTTKICAIVGRKNSKGNAALYTTDVLQTTIMGDVGCLA